MPNEKSVTSPDLVGILKTHIELFRAEEAKRWARINSDPDLITLRAEDPDFLRNYEPLNRQELNGVVVIKLGENHYQVGDIHIRIGEEGQYLLSIPY